jgi:drug/metabolite transporter (DMT)-like permease
MLVLATLCWGLSFPLMKNWLNAAEQDHCPGGDLVAALTLQGFRSLLALPLLAVFQPRWFRVSRGELGLGLLLGSLNGAGCALQAWGLAHTTPALSVFFTSLASAWVPLLAFALFRVTVARLTLFGLLVGMAGAAVLGGQTGEAWALGWGEWLTLLSTFVFALYILLLDRFGRDRRPGTLTVGLIAASGLPALAGVGAWAAGAPAGSAWPGWAAAMLTDPYLLANVGALTLFSTVLATHWMSVYQPRLPASRAALIYLLEPVFGAAFSVAWGHDPLTRRLLLGGGLILGGNFLAELPAWLRLRKGRAAPAEYEEES